MFGGEIRNNKQVSVFRVLFENNSLHREKNLGQGFSTSLGNSYLFNQYSVFLLETNQKMIQYNF